MSNEDKTATLEQQAERQRQWLARYSAEQQAAQLEAEAKEKQEHGLSAARQRAFEIKFGAIKDV